MALASGCGEDSSDLEPMGAGDTSSMSTGGSGSGGEEPRGGASGGSELCDRGGFLLDCCVCTDSVVCLSGFCNAVIGRPQEGLCTMPGEDFCCIDSSTCFTGLSGSPAMAAEGGAPSDDRTCSPQNRNTPAGPVLLDFSSGPVFADPEGVSGSVDVFSLSGDGALVGDASAGHYQVTGEVGDMAAITLSFDSCVDLSDFTGVSFRIGGTAGPSGEVLFIVDSDASTSIDLGGSCTDLTCLPPYAPVTVTLDAMTVNLDWTDLAGGTTVDSDTSAITGFSWAFGWIPRESTPYPVDLTLDDIALLP